MGHEVSDKPRPRQRRTPQPPTVRVDRTRGGPPARNRARSSGTRITNQFRTREAMVYELAHDDVRLRIQMTQRENQDGLGDWTAEAHVRVSADSPSITKPGLTREHALRALARAWVAKRRTDGFPEMDWNAVATAMRAVRAI